MNKYEGHTPGPWRENWDDSGFYAIYSTVVPYRCNALIHGDSDEDKANAALIADAPELLRQRDALLAALERIADQDEWDATWETPGHLYRELLFIAREAIEATKGGA